VDVPPKLRTTADILALHRPWCAAVGAGLLRVSNGQVTGGPALEHWPPAEADLLMSGVARAEARDLIRSAVDRILALWS